MPNLYFGCHLSAAKGFLAMGKTALTLGADTFQFFTRNPRGTKAKAIDPADITALRALLAEHGFGPLIAHAPYTLNACALDPRVREFARQVFTDDLARLAALPEAYYNFHPGSHVGAGAAAGIVAVAELLDEVLLPEQTTVVLLETMAGKGTELGRSFGELAEIISRVRQNKRLGVCLDTCHIWDAGYDIAADLDQVLLAFDQEIGLTRLAALHLNDSLNPLGAKKDRHACLGKGNLGLSTFRTIVRHPALQNLPCCLETPNDLPGYAAEIALLRSFVAESS